MLKIPRARDLCPFMGSEHTKEEGSLNLRESDHHAVSLDWRPPASRGKEVLDRHQPESCCLLASSSIIRLPFSSVKRASNHCGVPWRGHDGGDEGPDSSGCAVALKELLRAGQRFLPQYMQSGWDTRLGQRCSWVENSSLRKSF